MLLLNTNFFSFIEYHEIAPQSNCVGLESTTNSFVFPGPCCSITQSCPTLWSHGLQHARLPWPALSPEVCSNSCPLSQWCRPTIQFLKSWQILGIIRLLKVLPFRSHFISCERLIGILILIYLISKGNNDFICLLPILVLS